DLPALDAPRRVHVDRGRARHLADVRAGGERALRAADDDAADGVVAIELLERGDELVHELARERVQLLRPVQEADPDLLVPLDEEDAHTSTVVSESAIERSRASPIFLVSRPISTPFIRKTSRYAPR